VLDELVAQVVHSFHGAIEQRIEGLANDVKRAIGAPSGASTRAGSMTYGASASGAHGASEGSSGIPRAD
jgi:hypothetical protein